jgi:transposase InsO family protein
MLSRPAGEPAAGADLSWVETCPGQPNINRPGPQSSVDSAVREPLVVAAAVESAEDFAAMAAAQKSCTDCTEMQQLSFLAVKPYVVSGVNILCDFSTGSPRPLVPAAYRAAVFESLHGLAHPGVRGTRRLVSKSFVLPGMSADIREKCRSCVQCARSKVHVHVKAPVQPIAVPPQPFNHVHIDIVGLLPATASGKVHLFTVMDRSTRWVEVIPLADTSAAGCAEAMIGCWISRFGVPACITSDRGPQFTLELWARLCSSLGIVHKQTTAYHPQANGLVERFHRQLKAALRARLNSSDWEQQLPWVMLGPCPKRTSTSRRRS